MVNLTDKSALTKESATHFKRSSDVSLLMGAIKYGNFGLQYQYNHQPVSWLTLQAMADVNILNYDIYSASSKYNLQATWIPISVGSRINIFRSKKYAGYAFGKYGWAFGLGGQGHSIQSKPSHEYGIGSLLSVLDRERVLLKVEIGRQEYTLKGMANSDFQSIINYDLLFNSYFLRTGLVYILE